MLDIDLDLLAHSTFDIELNCAGVAHEFWRNVNLHALVSNDSVWGEVLAFEMHVDRHVIFGAASTYGRDEVDRDDPALLAN